MYFYHFIIIIIFFSKRKGCTEVGVISRLLTRGMEKIHGAVKLPMCETDLILVENILTIALTQYAIMHT